MGYHPETAIRHVPMHALIRTAQNNQKNTDTAKEEILRRLGPVIRRTVARLQGIEAVEDLYQMVKIECLTIIQDFDETHMSFESYATMRLKWFTFNIRRTVARKKKGLTVIRYDQAWPADDSGSGNEIPVALDGADSEGLERAHRHQARIAVRTWINFQRPRDARILQGIFWEEGRQVDVARGLGMRPQKLNDRLRRLYAQGRIALADFKP